MAQAQKLRGDHRMSANGHPVRVAPDCRNGQTPSATGQSTGAAPDAAAGFTALVRELHEAGVTDLDELTRRALEDASTEMRAAIIRTAVRQHVRRILGQPQRSAKESFARFTQEDDGIDRWRAAWQKGSGAAQIHNFYIGLYGKGLGDLTPDELEGYADYLKEQAVAVADTSQRYRAAAQLGRKLKAKLMSDVPVEKLAEVFYA